MWGIVRKWVKKNTEKVNVSKSLQHTLADPQAQPNISPYAKEP